MKILSAVCIEHMHSAYESQLTIRMSDTLDTQYYCAICKGTFAASWTYKGWYTDSYGDAAVFCPSCGFMHSRYAKPVSYGNMKRLSSADYGPLNMHLAVYEGKDFIVLKVNSRAVRFRAALKPNSAQVYEEFRFNTKLRKATFKSRINGYAEKEIELGSPFIGEDALDNVLDISILRFLTADAIHSTQRKNVDNLLKKLREALVKKLSVRLGYKVKSMYTSCGSESGRALVPLLNMAYRMVFIDANNLKASFFRDNLDHTHYLGRYFIDNNDIARFSDLAIFRKAASCIDAVIDTYELPNLKAVRKVLQQNIFAGKLIKAALTITNDVNYLPDIYTLLEKRYGCSLDARVRFYAAMEKLYGMKAVLKLMDMHTEVKNTWGGSYYKDSEADDITNMYFKLSKEAKEKLKEVKFRDLHDYLSAELAKLDDSGCKFDVPEEIARRLMMQTDLIKFYLPDTSGQLKFAGKIMHNCVGSYGDRMARQELNIVLVADDTGRLVSCLEIKGDKVVQAKLRYNKPVKQDAKINAEVIEWAEAAGLKIATNDVRELYLPAVLAAV